MRVRVTGGHRRLILLSKTIAVTVLSVVKSTTQSIWQKVTFSSNWTEQRTVTAAQSCCGRQLVVTCIRLKPNTIETINNASRHQLEIVCLSYFLARVKTLDIAIAILYVCLSVTLVIHA